MYGTASAELAKSSGKGAGADAISGGACLIDRMGGGITIYTALPVDVADVSK